MREPYSSIVPKILRKFGIQSVLSIDLETIILNRNNFLTNETIIAVSLSYVADDLKTELFISQGEDTDSETQLLQKLDLFLDTFRPSLIIGYNQTGYDIPLLRIKMARLPYARQIWNAKYVLSTAYCLDMMQVISDFLGDYDGDYRYRKLSDVVSHEAFMNLPLDRKKQVVIRDDMNIGEAIYDLWKRGSPEFMEYCRGDTRDVLNIFRYIFRA
ncbi:MAG: hypothetical protein M1431_00610 [Candidatus Thermoplasmatota archaeon]|nr:hypothetical protein [Candidatus Thermoplasmatota archaeon]